jgi:hypothetical protein
MRKSTLKEYLKYRLWVVIFIGVLIIGLIIITVQSTEHNWGNIASTFCIPLAIILYSLPDYADLLFCTNCHNRVKKTDKYCPQCKNDLRDNNQ